MIFPLILAFLLASNTVLRTKYSRPVIVHHEFVGLEICEIKGGEKILGFTVRYILLLLSVGVDSLYV